uniref:Uncharacterized protein n=1 Tax=Cacopsylla melanoneura TaxID=428564 RepID=A0A8D8LS56_9HEMI
MSVCGWCISRLAGGDRSSPLELESLGDLLVFRLRGLAPVSLVTITVLTVLTLPASSALVPVFVWSSVSMSELLITSKIPMFVLSGLRAPMSYTVLFTALGPEPTALVDFSKLFA